MKVLARLELGCELMQVSGWDCRCQTDETRGELMCQDSLSHRYSL